MVGGLSSATLNNSCSILLVSHTTGMNTKIIVLGLLLLLSVVADAQTWSTNKYYHAHEFTAELTPTISSPSLLGFGNYTYGASFEYEYWQSLTMGTGFEVGSYDLSTHVIDHIAIMEDYRLVCVPDTLLFDKFALVAKVGAETYFVDGTKDVEIGFGVNYNLLVKKVRVEANIMQHFRTNPSKDGSTLRVGLQYVF